MSRGGIIPGRDVFQRLGSARAALDRGRPDTALSLLRGRADAAVACEVWLLRGEALRGRGFFWRAQTAYRASLEACGAEDRDLAFTAWLGLARCLRSLGEAAAARRALRGAAKSSPGESDDRETLALEDALIDRAEGFYGRALRKLLPLRAVSRRRKDWPAVGFLLWATGGARRFSGDLAGSQRDFQSSLAVFRRAGDREGEVYALFGLGGIARVRGRFAQARKAYAQAAKKLGRGPDLFGRAYAHCGLANVLRQMGELREAEGHYQRSYRLYARLDDRVDLAYVDWGLGQVHLKRGELLPARRRLRAALKAFAAGHEARGEVLSLHALAQVLHALGRTGQAERLFDAAVSRGRRAGLHAHLEIFT